MFCSDCGRKLPTEELLPFCPYCGKRLIGEDEPLPDKAQPEKKKRINKPLFITAAVSVLLICGLLFTSLYFLKRWRDASADPKNRQAAAVALAPAQGTGTIYPGDTVSLELKLYPENASPAGAVWSSSDIKIASVDNNGNVRFMAEGAAKISVRLENGVEGEIELTASKKPYRLSIGDDYIELQIMAGRKLVPVVWPEDAKYDGIIWESSDRSILRVDQDGTITGVAQGLATVTATIAGTVIAQTDVFVYEYRFDLLNDHLVRRGQKFVRGDGLLEYYVTLDYKEEKRDGVTLTRHTFLAYFPESDRSVLCCYVTDSDTSFVYETMVYLDKSNKTSVKFDVYCYAKNGSSISGDMPLSTVGALNISGFGSISVAGYRPGDELQFNKYEGDETFRENALEITRTLIGDSLRALWDSWEGFGLGHSMTELTGFDFS